MEWLPERPAAMGEEEAVKGSEVVETKAARFCCFWMFFFRRQLEEVSGRDGERAAAAAAAAEEEEEEDSVKAIGDPEEEGKGTEGAAWGLSE